MKLYIYEHCPFCARTRYVGRMLGIEFEEVMLTYEDEATPVALVGKKIVPILEKDDGSIMPESADIIAYFLSLKGQTFTQALPTTLDWQSATFPFNQKLGYPRMHYLPLGEFLTPESRVAWQAKKESATLNFEQLLVDTLMINQQTAPLLEHAEKNIQLVNGESTLPLFDQAIYFSLLRVLVISPELTWPTALITWLEKQSLATKIPLLR